MKRLVIAILILLPFAARAQQVVPPGYVLVDSLVFTPLAAVDSTLEGSTIFNALPDRVTVRQSGVIRNAVETRIRANRGKQFNGYRIRIFFDNSQSARSASEAALYRFKVLNPGVSSEALAALGAIKQQFPSAFIVQERFKYPAVENRSAYRVDTLKVLKKVD